jgi:hypothetical protein
MDKTMAEASIGNDKAGDLPAFFVIEPKNWYNSEPPEGERKHGDRKNGNYQYQPVFIIHWSLELSKKNRHRSRRKAFAAWSGFGALHDCAAPMKRGGKNLLVLLEELVGTWVQGQ